MTAEALRLQVPQAPAEFARIDRLGQRVVAER